MPTFSGFYRITFFNGGGFADCVEYRLKSIPDRAVTVPEEVFRNTADTYFLLTGRDKELAIESLEHQSYSAAIQVLDALHLGQLLVPANMMIGHTPVGQAIIWLGIARAFAVSRWSMAAKRSSRERELAASIPKLDALVRELHPDAEKAYNSNCALHAQGPKNLGVAITQYPAGYSDHFR